MAKVRKSNQGREAPPRVPYVLATTPHNLWTLLRGCEAAGLRAARAGGGAHREERGTVDEGPWARARLCDWLLYECGCESRTTRRLM